MKTYRIRIVNHKFPSLNEIIAAAKSHWAKYSEMKKRETLMVAQEAYRAKGKGFKTLWRVSIFLTFYEDRKGRKRDWDNITAAKKFILDGLVDSKFIVDDSPRTIVLVSEEVVYSDFYGVSVDVYGSPGSSLEGEK